MRNQLAPSVSTKSVAPLKLQLVARKLQAEAVTNFLGFVDNHDFAVMDRIRHWVKHLVSN